MIRPVRVLRNLPLASSVAARAVREDPVNAFLLALRLVPTKVKAHTVPPLLGLAGDGRAPVVESVLLWDLGRRDEAVRRVRSTLPRVGARQTRRLAAFALAVDRATLAREALDRLPPGDPARPRLAALAAWREGRLRDAAVEAVAPSRARGLQRRRNQRMAARMQGELRVLQPGWSPAAGRGVTPYVARPRRVLHVVTNSLPWHTAGYGVRTHAIACAQRDAGLDPHVVTRLGYPVEQGHPTARTLDVLDGIPYHRLLPVSLVKRPEDVHLAAHVEAAATLVADLQPAILHAASKHLNGQVALALRERFGIPVVYEVRGFLEETWLSRHGASVAGTDRYELARAVETDCMLRADLVVTLGEAMRAEILSRGVPPDRVVVVPNAVDEMFLAPVPDASDLRTSLGLKPDDVVVGLVSSLVGYEGVATLLDAVRLLADDGAPVRGLVVGDGTERAALEERARELGLGDTVVFTGRVPFAAVRDYHAALDVFCVPRADAQVTRLVTPLKPLEAMATGRPVVASRLPALEEIVEEGVTGLFAEPGSPESWAETLRPLLYDGPGRQSLGRAARTHVLDERTWSALVRRYLAAYASLGVTT